jgi:hypothetical protein
VHCRRTRQAFSRTSMSWTRDTAFIQTSWRRVVYRGPPCPYRATAYVSVCIVEDTTISIGALRSQIPRFVVSSRKRLAVTAAPLDCLRGLLRYRRSRVFLSLEPYTSKLQDPAMHPYRSRSIFLRPPPTRRTSTNPSHTPYHRARRHALGHRQRHERREL